MVKLLTGFLWGAITWAATTLVISSVLVAVIAFIIWGTPSLVVGRTVITLVGVMVFIAWLGDNTNPW